MVARNRYSIRSITNELDNAIWDKINQKTKPIGALGKLESLAFKIARIQQTLNPQLKKPTIAVFAGDHGIAKSGLVNIYPQEVTYQMVMNFLHGGAAINVFSMSNDIEVKVIDSGVNYQFSNERGLINAKMGLGTSDYRFGKAMTAEVCEATLLKGSEIIDDIVSNGTNIIGFGEMGIGNTSSAALIMSAVTNFPLSDCVGKGTGANETFLQQKVSTLLEVEQFHKLTPNHNPLEILATYGGFEIAQMTGGMLSAASKGVVILVDGFISTVALLMANCINPLVKDYAIFTHLSEEKGHASLLRFLGVEAVLDLGMRLGEGTGCAVAYPLLIMAVDFLNDMASFETADITEQQTI